VVVEDGFPAAFGDRAAVVAAARDGRRDGEQGAVDDDLTVGERAGQLGFVQAQDLVE
jgi:hypothetical protein